MLPGVRTHTVLFSRRSPSQFRLTRGSITLTWSSLTASRSDQASELNAERSFAISFDRIEIGNDTTEGASGGFYRSGRGKHSGATGSRLPVSSSAAAHW